MKHDNNKSEPKDLPRNKKIDEQLASMNLIINANKFLSKIGLGNKKLRSMESQIADIKNQQNELTTYPTKYNSYFSANGWIAHDSMNFDVIKNAVDLYEGNEQTQAEEVIKNYYSPAEVESRLIYFRNIPEFQIRMKFLEFALLDYKEKRYYSVIPLLLMIVDGVINDVMQRTPKLFY